MSDNEPYSICSYFDPNSSNYHPEGSPKCPGHCDRYAHVRENNYTVYDEKEEENEQLLKQTIEKMRQEDEVIIKQMKDIKESLEELDKIALKPRVLTNAEYFQQMIDYEKKQKRAGYLKRIEELEMMKNQA